MGSIRGASRPFSASGSTTSQSWCVGGLTQQWLLLPLPPNMPQEGAVALSQSAHVSACPSLAATTLPPTLPCLASHCAQGDGVVQLEAGKTDKNAVLTGSWRNTEADPIIRKAGIPIVPSFNETLWMADMHRDNGQGHECTHFCHPSAPQVLLGCARLAAVRPVVAAGGRGGAALACHAMPMGWKRVARCMFFALSISGQLAPPVCDLLQTWVVALYRALRDSTS
jgi:hypothetical protein